MQFIAHFFRPLHPECYKLARVSLQREAITNIYSLCCRYLQSVSLFHLLFQSFFFSSSYSHTHPAPCRYTLSSFCGYRFLLSIRSCALNTNRAICMAADQYQKIQGAPSVCDPSAFFEVRKMGVPERGWPVWRLLYVCWSIDTEWFYAPHGAVYR